MRDVLPPNTFAKILHIFCQKTTKILDIYNNYSKEKRKPPCENKTRTGET